MKPGQKTSVKFEKLKDGRYKVQDGSNSFILKRYTKFESKKKFLNGFIKNYLAETETDLKTLLKDGMTGAKFIEFGNYLVERLRGPNMKIQMFSRFGDLCCRVYDYMEEKSLSEEDYRDDIIRGTLTNHLQL